MPTDAADDRSGRRFGQARSGARSVFAYGLSMAMLAVASLSAIPAMVTASGATAWGMIALGQSIGGIGAAVLAYGWGLSGPAFVARADERGRLTEFAESVAAKMLLFVPVAGIAFVVAAAIGGDYWLFAGVGAISMACTGLSANWFFVGMRQPYRLLVCETIPRVAGTVVGILLMTSGASALIGVTAQLVGMVLGAVVSGIVILSPWRRDGLGPLRRRRVHHVLAAQRLGVTSSVVSSLYSAVPIVIVTIVAPSAQPVYAVVEKVQRQVFVALGPFVTVLQGWVPRGPEGAINSRVRQGMIAAVVSSSFLTIAMFAVAPELVSWLGGGQIDPSILTLALMATITGVSLLEAMTGRACLAALRRLDVVSRATAIGSVVGLPLVGVGAFFFGAAGGLGGILVGLIVRLMIELVGMHRTLGGAQPLLGGSPRDPDVSPDPLVG